MTTLEIPLTQGLFARIDSSDLELVRPFTWHAVKAKKCFYAASRTSGKTVYMHRLVMGVAQQGRDVFVDHIDFDGLNNVRQNLQACTPGENARKSRTKRVFFASKGVSLVHPGIWMARIVHEGKDHYLGTYQSEREAAIAYDAAATVLFGRFAVRNFQ